MSSLINLVNFRSIDVDEENKVAWVQSGAIIGELYYRIAEKSKSLAFLGALCHTMGIGGYFSGGGYDLLFRKYGLAADNIIDAQLIDVNGRVLDRKCMGEDLFWAIRGGGGGLSYVSHVPFIIVDLVNFRSVDIDDKNKVAWIQSGAILGEFYYGIAQKSRTLAFPAGICHTVGIGGYFSGGGYGLLFRKYGLAVDNIIDALFIDVNGRILDRESMGEDLFWAIRGGGGGSFGIVLAWKVKLVSVPATVTVFSISRTLEQNATKLVHRWQYVAHKLPDDMFSVVTMTRVNSSQDGKRTILASFSSFFLGGIDELIPLMQERFPELGLVKEDCTEMSWIESILYFGQIQNKSLDILLDRSYKTTLNGPSFKTKSDYVKKPIPETALEEIWSKLYEEDAESAVIGFIAYGGKMDEITESATPFPHRAGNLYKIAYTVGWQQEDNIKSRSMITASHPEAESLHPTEQMGGHRDPCELETKSTAPLSRNPKQQAAHTTRKRSHHKEKVTASKGHARNAGYITQEKNHTNMTQRRSPSQRSNQSTTTTEHRTQKAKSHTESSTEKQPIKEHHQTAPKNQQPSHCTINRSENSLSLSKPEAENLLFKT
ncbi:FAD linked oxidase [Theobroma cacao]|nr:FAD linked oxidase [Theobroma cacao]